MTFSSMFGNKNDVKAREDTIVCGSGWMNRGRLSHLALNSSQTAKG